MRKSLFFLIILVILASFSLVSAENFVKNGESYNIVEVCTFDGHFCDNSSTTSNITVISPDGTVLVNNLAMTPDGSVFNYTLNGSQTTVNGQYSITVIFLDPPSNFIELSDTFTVNPSGTEITTAKSLIYMVGWFLIVLLMVTFIAVGFSIDGSNTIRFNQYLEINYLKYLKQGLFFLAYVLFIVTIYLTWILSEQILDLDLITGLLGTFHVILWKSFYPIVILWICLLILIIFADFQSYVMGKRNVPLSRKRRRGR